MLGKSLTACRRQDPRARAWVPMVGSLLAVPCWMGVVSGANFYVSLAFLLAEYVVAECWFGPTVTILQEGLPSTVRGVGQGVFRWVYIMWYVTNFFLRGHETLLTPCVCFGWSLFNYSLMTILAVGHSGKVGRKTWLKPGRYM